MISQTFTFGNETSGSPTGEPGSPSFTAVFIIDDSLIEPTEMIIFSASLDSPTPDFDVNTQAILVVDSGTISIEDNDGKYLLICYCKRYLNILLCILISFLIAQALTVSIEISAYSVSETDGSLEVCVVVDAGTIAPNGPTLNLTLESSDGTAVGTIIA